MPDIKNTQNIEITGSSNVSLSNIHNTATHTQKNENVADEITQAFEQIILRVNLLPEGTDKMDAQTAVKALEAEAHKGEDAQEKIVQKWITFLLETSSDIWEVVIDTLIHPVKGISTVFQKIAKRAKEEQSLKNSNINSTTISE